MNNAYYNNNAFPGNPIYSGKIPTPNQEMAPNYNMSNNNQIDMPMEQSYIENILRLNKGKQVRVLMIYVDFITFDEKINYSPEFIPNN